MKDHPNYYGILPAKVRYCEALPPLAKVLFSEITALSNQWGYCTATNGYFADLYASINPKTGERKPKGQSTIRRLVSKLQDEGFIKVQVDRISGKGTYRKIYPIVDLLGVAQKLTGDGSKIGYQKNNTSNNKEESSSNFEFIDITAKKKYYIEDKRQDKNLPFDVVSSSQTLRAFYSEDTKELRGLLKDCFELDATHEEISECINSFATVAVDSDDDRYKNYKDIRTIEKLKGKFLKWIPTHLKHMKLYPKQFKPKRIKRKHDYSLSKYYETNYLPKHFRKIKANGVLEKDLEQFSNEFDKLLEISANYPSNDSFNPMLVFEVLHKPLGRFLPGSTPKRKEASLLRFMEKQNEYNQARGDVRKLLKKERERQAL
jgi:hypothetical protein